MDTSRQEVIVTQDPVRGDSPNVSKGFANMTDADGPGSGPLGNFIRASMRSGAARLGSVTPRGL